MIKRYVLSVHNNIMGMKELALGDWIRETDIAPIIAENEELKKENEKLKKQVKELYRLANIHLENMYEGKFCPDCGYQLIKGEPDGDKRSDTEN